MMVEIVYSRGWSKKPFPTGRPFVKLKDYEELRKKYEDLLLGKYEV